MAGAERTIIETLAPKLEPLGILVEDVTVVPAGKRRLVRILLDRIVAMDTATTEPVALVTLDEVAEATRVVSDELDATNVMGEQPYVLEVSSPGTDRPLTEPRHFARNVGRLVAITLDDGSKIAGRLTSADATEIVVTPEQGGKKAGGHASAEPTRLEYPTITSAKVQVEFTHGGDTDGVGEDV